MHGSLRRCNQEIIYVVVFVEVLIVFCIFQGAFIRRNNINNDNYNNIDSVNSNDEIDKLIPRLSRVSETDSIQQHLVALRGDNPEIDRKHPLTCREIDHMVLGHSLGRGTTKTVFQSTFAGQTVAVKMVTNNVKDIVACRKRKGVKNLDSCFKFAQYKILKEISLLDQLHHPNVAQLLGSCIRNGVDENDKVIMIMEVGTPVNIRTMTWSNKLQVVLDIAELLHYFHNSPIGQIRIGDFKKDQFRMINGTVKISDLDDLTVEENSCDDESDCFIMGSNKGVPCIQTICKDFNTIANIKVANKLFFNSVFSIAPTIVRDESTDLLQALSKSTIDTETLRDKIVSIKRKHETSPTTNR